LSVIGWVEVFAHPGGAGATFAARVVRVPAADGVEDDELA
jgi:hypothetical protein